MLTTRLWLFLGVLLPQILKATSFSSIIIFGDNLSATTDPTGNNEPSFGSRFTNGRVWAEVLAEWQGLTLEDANNISTDNQLIGEVTNKVTSGLFFTLQEGPGNFNNIPFWTNFANETITQLESAIGALYQAGMRHLILPNTVDLIQTPVFAAFLDGQPTAAAFIRARIQEYNLALSQSISSLRTNFPDLEIYEIDAFSFFDEIIANPTAFNLINEPNDFNPAAVGVFEPFPAGSNQLAGPGANFVFWNLINPTATVHFLFASLVQEILTPLEIHPPVATATGIQVTGSNLPINRDGFILGTSTLILPFDEDLTLLPTATTETFTMENIPGEALDNSRFFQFSFTETWVFP